MVAVVADAKRGRFCPLIAGVVLWLPYQNMPLDPIDWPTRLFNTLQQAISNSMGLSTTDTSSRCRPPCRYAPMRRHGGRGLLISIQGAKICKAPDQMPMRVFSSGVYYNRYAHAIDHEAYEGTTEWLSGTSPLVSMCGVS